MQKNVRATGECMYTPRCLHELIQYSCSAHFVMCLLPGSCSCGSAFHASWRVPELHLNSNSVSHGDHIIPSASNLFISGNLRNVHHLSFPSGTARNDLVRSHCHTQEEPVLPPHVECVIIVPLVMGWNSIFSPN